MSNLIDTNIAINLRDGDPDTIDRLATLQTRPSLSIITQIELEGGIAAKPEFSALRRQAMDAMLETLTVLPFDGEAASAYRAIIAARGYSRPRILDRMIAATALVHGLRLITANGDDFADVPGLALERW